MLADQAMPGQPSQNNENLNQCQKIEHVLGCLESLSEIDERSDAELNTVGMAHTPMTVLTMTGFPFLAAFASGGGGKGCDSPDHFETRLSSRSMAAVKLLKQGFR